MKKYILFCFIFSVFANQIYAKDSQITKRISKIQETYQNINILEADFIQKTYVKLLDKNIEKNGKFYFKKEGMLRIEYLDTDKKYYISDGTTFWVYSKGDIASLQTYAVNEDNVPKEALSFLSGFGKIKEEFKVQSSDYFKNIDSGFIGLHLKPNNKKAQYKSLEALFNKDNLLIKLRILNLSENTTDYVFKNIKTNTNLKDDFFTLKNL